MVGLPADWPIELEVAAGLCLDAPVATCLVWGDTPLQVANEACRALLREGGQAGAVQPATESWGEGWPALGALIGQIGATGTALHANDVFLPCTRVSTGDLVRCSLHGSPVRARDGTVLGVVVTIMPDAPSPDGALQRDLHELLDAMPAAVYTTDAQGRLTHFNSAAVAFSGRTPQLGSDAWCVSWKLYAADGTPMPHDQCPMAVALRENRVVSGIEAIAERPDGTRRWFMPFPTPLRDAQGRVTGGVNMLVDITERKRTDAALESMRAELDQQRRLYEAILSNTPDLAYVFDLRHRFVYANESLLHMWGRTREEALGRTCLELGYERWHAAMHDREIDLVVETREPVRGQVPFQGTFGRRMYDYIFVPVIGADGEVTAVAGTTRDITDASEAERALRESRESQAFLLALGDTLRPLTDPVAIQSSASRMLGEKLAAVRVLYVECEADGEHFLAERAYEIPGTPPANGRHRLELLGTAPLAQLREGRTVAIDDVEAPGAPELDLALYASFCIRAHLTVPLAKEGRLIALFSVHDSEPRAWTREEIALVEETAERTWGALERARAESALRASRSQLLDELDGARRLQEISTELIHHADESFAERIVAAARAIMRADAASMQIHVQGRNELELLASSGFHPDSAAFWQRVRIDSSCSCGLALASGTRVIIEDLEADAQVASDDLAAYRRSSLRSVQSTPLVSRSGELLGMMSTHWNRPHRPSEHDLGLFDALARQAAELIERSRSDAAQRTLIARLAEQDQRKDEFLASLAHELRNPLAPLRNGLELMKLARDDPATVQRARVVMERQLRQMVRLVDDLLDVSRISRGILLLQKAPLDLAAVVASAVETSRPLIDAAGHVLAIELPPQPVIVDADETRLAQAFANLLNNAAKYTPAGGRIALGMRREDGCAVVTLQDNGIGIPPDMLPRVFDMFIQVDATRDGSRGGLGIGLTLVKRLIELHGGSIEAHSEGTGRGSTFSVRLPLAPPSVAEMPAPAPVHERRPRAARRVLVADDNRDAAASLSVVLELMGHVTRVAHDGAEALAIAEAFQPDIALLDIGMPNLDGHDLARLIRAQPWGRGTTLVALTGWGQDEDRRRSRAAGFDQHLVKPIEFDDLQRLLDT